MFLNKMRVICIIILFLMGIVESQESNAERLLKDGPPNKPLDSYCPYIRDWTEGILTSQENPIIVTLLQGGFLSAAFSRYELLERVRTNHNMEPPSLVIGLGLREIGEFFVWLHGKKLSLVFATRTQPGLYCLLEAK